MKKVLRCVRCKHLQNFPNPLLRVTSSLPSLISMEEYEGIRGAEGGSDPEFHEIPTQGSSHTSQSTYIRAPSQGLPTTTTTNQIVDSPNTFNTGNTPALTILFKMFREDGRPLPQGSFTKRSETTRVYSSTGVAVELVTMITPTDALIEFAPGTLVIAIAQVLHQISKWEDIPVWVTCLMGSKNYIMQLCRERVENEEWKRVWEAEAEKIREDQQEQEERLSELIDKVNDQTQLVGEMQQNNLAVPKESVSKISLLQGQSVVSTGSIPRIPSSLLTLTGVYSTTNPHLQHNPPRKNTKNPDLPTFSGEIPTPKGEVEYDNFVFQLQMLRSSYMDDAIRNAIVASVRTHAKIAIRAIGYGSSLDAMIKQLENRFGLGETVDILGHRFHQLMQQPKERVGEFGGNLEYKFRLLQEKCPGRFTEDQLRDCLFHRMSDKLRDSVRFLYSQPGCDFNTLLKAVLTCENEAVSRASTRAKSMQVDASENTGVAKTGISSIREQLDQMNAILKGANFKNNNGYKKRDKQDIKNKLKGTGTSAAGPFRRGKKPVQCYHCNGWGHYELQLVLMRNW